MNRTLRIGLSLLVVTLAAFGCATSGDGDGWTTLLDGSKPHTFENWYRAGDQANWRIVDGAVQADRGGKSSSYLVSKDSYRDFEVRAEFWADPTTNSGIFIRISDPRNIGTKTAYEVNINDRTSNAGYGTGGIPNFAKADTALKAGGKWNTYLITAKGSTLTVRFNGEQTVSIDDTTFGSGPIALQFGGATSGPIKFRKVEIRPL